MVVKQAEQNMNQGGRTPRLRTAVIAAAITFIIAFVLSSLILDWVASAVLGVFLGAIVVVLVLGDES